VKSSKGKQVTVILLTLLVIAVIGAGIAFLPDDMGYSRAEDSRAQEIDLHFKRGIVMLHARRYEEAAVSYHAVLKLAPRLPEAHVNMGFALLGLERAAAAANFFMTAIELRPQQANAYYGLAVSYEQLQDVEAARGAMRTFIHLAEADNQYLPKARAALWEWESERNAQIK
jgi:Flp pilus assembly protein TadD